MWNRVDIKMRGKGNFLKNYGPAVLVSLITVLVTIKLNYRFDSDGNPGAHIVLEQLQLNMGYFGLGLGIAGVVKVILDIFIFQVFVMGAARFYVENRDYNAPISKILFGFQSGYYGNVALVMFMKNLFISLWSLLFVIPGIVKSYSYRMVPYILAEQPDIRYQDAIRISREMMNGNKFDAFVFDLSFLGWDILAVFTCGILGVFYVKPYQDAANAELYTVLRDQWFGRNQQSDMF